MQRPNPRDGFFCARVPPPTLLVRTLWGGKALRPAGLAHSTEAPKKSPLSAWGSGAPRPPVFPGGTPRRERTRAGHLRWRPMGQRLWGVAGGRGPGATWSYPRPLGCWRLFPNSSTGGAVRPRAAAAAVDPTLRLSRERSHRTEVYATERKCTIVSVDNHLPSVYLHQGSAREHLPRPESRPSTVVH